MNDREKVINLLSKYINCSFGDKDEKVTVEEIIALLKAQEPIKPILARGWYWCGGVGCRNSLTSALDDDSPVLKPNYCEKCGRAVKWK